MDPTGPVSGQTSIPAARPDAGGSVSWQVGQVLRALVVSQQPDGLARLQVGNQLVQGQSPVPLQSGQSLSLQVEALTPQPLLRILAAAGNDPVQNAVRTILPRQDSLAPLLNNLVRLANARQPVLPPLLQELSRNLVRQLPEPKTVSHPQGLRQAVEQSGLFLESKLVAARDSGRVDLSTDFKANLLRLVQLVRNWPGLSGNTGTQPRTGAPPPGPATPPPAPPATPTGGPVAPAAPTPAAAAGTTTALPAGAVPVPGTAPATDTTRPPAAPPPPAAPATHPGATRAAGANVDPGRAATLARGLQAGTPLPTATATGTTTIPPPPVPASALAGMLGTQPGLVILAPPLPPQRGQAPTPQPRAGAGAPAPGLLSAGAIRGELQQQADAAVARLQLSQLASLPQDRQHGLEWLLDLPIRRGEETDVWSLQIRRDEGREGRPGETPAPSWTVHLAFDLPGLGPVQARVMLRGERISTWFWATREETVPFLHRHLQELHRELENAGLEVDELGCRHGSIPRETGPAPAGRSLLNERV